MMTQDAYAAAAYTLSAEGSDNLRFESRLEQCEARFACRLVRELP